MPNREKTTKTASRKTWVITALFYLAAGAVIGPSREIATALTHSIHVAIPYFYIEAFGVILLGIGNWKLFNGDKQSLTPKETVKSLTSCILGIFLVVFSHPFGMLISSTLRLPDPSSAVMGIGFFVMFGLGSSGRFGVEASGYKHEPEYQLLDNGNGIRYRKSQKDEHLWSDIEVLAQSPIVLVIMIDEKPAMLLHISSGNTEVANAIIDHCSVRANYVADLMGDWFVEEARSHPSDMRRIEIIKELAETTSLPTIGASALLNEVAPEDPRAQAHNANLEDISLGMWKSKTLRTGIFYLLKRGTFQVIAFFCAFYIPAELYMHYKYACGVSISGIEAIIIGSAVLSFAKFLAGGFSSSRKLREIRDQRA